MFDLDFFVDTNRQLISIRKATENYVRGEVERVTDEGFPLKGSYSQQLYWIIDRKEVVNDLDRFNDCLRELITQNEKLIDEYDEGVCRVIEPVRERLIRAHNVWKAYEDGDLSREVAEKQIQKYADRTFEEWKLFMWQKDTPGREREKILLQKESMGVPLDEEQQEFMTRRKAEGQAELKRQLERQEEIEARIALINEYKSKGLIPKSAKNYPSLAHECRELQAGNITVETFKSHVEGILKEYEDPASE